MSDPEKPKSEARPESPTTAKALDFDDDNTETNPSTPSKSQVSGTTIQADKGEGIAPPKPPRPLSPQQQAENTLKEAFPSIDASVVKAVLRASGGNVEPAFNALLGMSDPDAAEPAPPPQPPRRQQSPVAPNSTEQDQLAADERYARQLAEHYNGMDTHGFAPRRQYPTQSRRQPRPVADDDEDRERSFFDDDLPVIRDNIKKGFLETQSTVNSWVNRLKKRIDGEDDDDDFQRNPAVPAQGYAHQNTFGGRQSSDFGRRSADRERYDADHQVLGDDFASLQLNDNEAQGERRAGRPLANPDLFKPTPPRPHSGSNRRVSFQEGPPEEIDIHYPKSPSPNNRPLETGAKASKWQPLAAVEPSPVAEHDPFSLGDSDDEDSKKKDGKADDNDRLQQAAAEAMADSIGSEQAPKSDAAAEVGKAGGKDNKTDDLMKKT